ncbi:hypothetical protein AGR1B_Cc120221 [Agrobacterium fabacearum S56]|nr:hypothetical protein AGR1C_Cc10600 [Agrobacterium fabacearum TT111]CUW88977.1 hypothetical protein AGR1B_Cc120221 [Agrobacterium fabacearum S56]
MDDTSGNTGTSGIFTSRRTDGPRTKRRRAMLPKRDPIKQYFLATALQAMHLWRSNASAFPEATS